jgi:hypothetical protein
MKRSILGLSAGLALLAVAFVGSQFVAESGLAQVASGPAQARPERPLPGRHIEGRLAFLRTELKITDTQAPLWDKVAAALRDRAAKRDAAIAAFRQARGAGTAPDLLAQMEGRIRAGEARLESDRAVLAAFRPLYAALSDAQKQTAEELFARHHRR